MKRELHRSWNMWRIRFATRILKGNNKWWKRIKGRSQLYEYVVLRWPGSDDLWKTTVVGFDEKMDLAVLKLDANVMKWINDIGLHIDSMTELGIDRKVRVGQTILSIRAPLMDGEIGNSPMLTMGVASGHVAISVGETNYTYIANDGKSFDF